MLSARYNSITVPTKALSQDKRIQDGELQMFSVDFIHSASTQIQSSMNSTITNPTDLCESLDEKSVSSVGLDDAVDLKKCIFGSLRHIGFLAARRSLMAQNSFHINGFSTPSSSRFTAVNEIFENIMPQKYTKEKRVMFSRSAILKSESLKTQIAAKQDSSESFSSSATVDPPFSLDGKDMELHIFFVN